MTFERCSVTPLILERRFPISSVMRGYQKLKGIEGLVDLPWLPLRRLDNERSLNKSILHFYNVLNGGLIHWNQQVSVVFKLIFGVFFVKRPHADKSTSRIDDS